MNLHTQRRYPTNDRMLRYPCLPHSVFTDTLIARTATKRGNNNSKVYGKYFGWTRLLPMKPKSDAHNTFPLIFKNNVVLPEIIMDN